MKANTRKNRENSCGNNKLKALLREFGCRECFIPLPKINMAPSKKNTPKNKDNTVARIAQRRQTIDTPANKSLESAVKKITQRRASVIERNTRGKQSCSNLGKDFIHFAILRLLELHIT